MGAPGKAFTFVAREQGDELTKIEILINMVIPQATIEGFEPRPTPSDWLTEGPRGEMIRPEPVVVEAAPADATATVTLPSRPLTLGSRIPRTRRRRRKRK